MNVHFYKHKLKVRKLIMTTQTKTGASSAIDVSKFTTKTAAILHLHAAGYKKSDISKILSDAYGKYMCYQQVYNTLKNVELRKRVK